jgi:hypothetical protein
MLMALLVSLAVIAAEAMGAHNKETMKTSKDFMIANLLLANFLTTCRTRQFHSKAKQGELKPQRTLYLRRTVSKPNLRT